VSSRCRGQRIAVMAGVPVVDGVAAKRERAAD
jgi:Asp/Glu/hydantoin racemase